MPAESGGSKSWRKVGADHTILAEWAGLTAVIACWISDVAMTVSALQHALRVASLQRRGADANKLRALHRRLREIMLMTAGIHVGCTCGLL
ncbi:hypothetical protein [Xanthomonas campestris]|uniref:hypothetical protein n=1 Tax=Xanthomonas campestris TaxID=339 RepID=UPI002B22C0BC|nr:hypothetical protein [Xanthomonas campestris]MEA9921101.1 hypothetical protein [Xanthomonas campestris pv. raphani]